MSPRPFSPIAIVGASCTLPGAHSPDTLWRAARDGRDLLGPVPPDRWGVPLAEVLREPGTSGRDGCWTDRGGYVEDFDARFDPNGFRGLEPERVAGLDPVFRWVLHGAREALRDAGAGPAPDTDPRRGLVLGNLSFPTRSLAHLAEAVWLRENGVATADPPDALERFMSGLPAQLAAHGLGLGLGGFALDAACASSLYAIKLACDRLHDGDADLMLAGAVNAADDLFIHVGFTALQALSPSGHSRPFHRSADGLVPAEGAAFVALQRLDDALRDGRRVLGVIRGVGLSNDGRGGGLLAPAEEGQRRAMAAAWASAGLEPTTAGLLECHATGTPVGDATEIRSAGAVFGGAAPIPIGSLKSNLGHLITVAGMAGLMKLLGALREGVRPPTLHADEPIPALAGAPFRLLHKAEPWPSDSPRRAALSAFGFGGNNAHLIVDEWRGGEAPRVSVPALPSDEIAVVGVGVIAAGALGPDELARVLVAGDALPADAAGSTPAVTLDARRIRFPPRDLQSALPQQWLVLATAEQALSGCTPPPRERTAILTGMQTDTRVARYGARWRLGAWARDATDAWREIARDAFAGTLDAAGVLGTMPNLCANRLNSQYDLAGPSFALSAEEASGLVGLELAARALRAGEIDAAVVSAVDASAEPVQAAAARASLGADRQPPGDAAATLVLKRAEDARRAGDPILARLEPGDDGREALAVGPDGVHRLTPLVGHAHAAAGLVHAAAALLALKHRLRPGRDSGPAQPWLERGDVRVSATTSTGERRSLRLAHGGSEPVPTPGLQLPRLHRFAGRDRAAVRRALADDRPVGADAGPASCVLVASDPGERERQRRHALEALDAGRSGTLGDGIAFSETPIGGETAFVFGAPASAYAGMGRDLLLARPDLTDALARRSTRLPEAAAWLYDEDAAPRDEDLLWGSSFLCQIHADLSRRVLGLSPDAAIGFCSGETNALYALGAWNDLDALHDEIRAAGIYDRELSGRFEAVARAWGIGSGERARWRSWRILAPLDRVRTALAGEERVHLTIVNAPGDCVIGGDERGAERVVERIGRGRARPLGYDIAVHCPELAEVRETWRRLHHRETRPVPGVRFYSGARRGAYAPDADSAADALLELALHPVDFPALIERAWADGVRVFVEHGPRDACSRWIGAILGDRPHLAVALDAAGRSPVRQIASAVAELIAAGVPLSTDLFDTRPPAPAPHPEVPLRLELPPPPRLPPRPTAPDLQPMPPAPSLPPVLAEVPVPAVTPPSPRRHPPAPPTTSAAPVLKASPAPAPGAPPTDVAAGIAAAQVCLDDTHRRFLAQQTAMHRRFLATRTAPPMSTAADGLATEPTPVVGRAAHPTPASGRAPLFDRRDLERLASGPISAVFGEAFREQDGFGRQVRMPEPPLLLADRVLSIDAEPRSMGRGTVVTQTDITPQAWYLHDGRMPAGILIESGQTDLLLISWLGIDFLNRGERVYRLLGCELTYHGHLPRPGETLEYHIHVDGHARHGDVRLFFFHYDCHAGNRPQLSVRQGQAGFFTDEELAESGGVLWEAETGEHSPDPRLDAGPVDAPPARLDRLRLEAFAAGDTAACFGAGYEHARTQVHSPRIAGGRMLLLHEVDALEPRGGPWGRGYLRARWRFRPDDWFFDGHFKDDPCMPGTLMFEGCLQAMAVYMAALGFTLERDAWRFEPVPEDPYRLRCRGQAIPTSQELVYEVFVDGLEDDPEPTLWADLLCTVDGVKAFHCRRMGLRLVPGFPLERRSVPEPTPRSREAAIERDGLRHDEATALATAWGAPSRALGPAYRRFDGPRRLARLPGPPYQFLSRIVRLDGEIGRAAEGATAVAEYDLPGDAWYDEGVPVMPFPVLLEAALQPCGWLALAGGAPLRTDEAVAFRNLDGSARILREITPGAGTLATRTTLTGVSRSGGMTLVSFDVACNLDGHPVLEMQTGFGFFPDAALARQVGLPRGAGEAAPPDGPGEPLDLAALRSGAAAGLALASPQLGMLDRITGWWPRAGRAGLGWLRGEKDVDPGQWFFKAHFFQDPVQPGSLGLEALLQLLRVYVLERALAEGFASPRFEPVALGAPLSWKYRGQVRPASRRVVVDLEVTAVEREQHGLLVRGDGWLGVDGTRIYAADLAVRVTGGD